MMKIQRYMRIASVLKSLVLTISIAFATQCAKAQDTPPPIEINKQTPYYIAVNNVKKSDIYDIQEGVLHIQYNDRYGKRDHVRLTIWNWNFQTENTFVLDKIYGLNQYTLDLTGKVTAFESGSTYRCKLEDEAGNTYEWSVRDIVPVKSKEFTVDIMVNPLNVSCSALEGNNVEFYGAIQKGKAPYLVHWYVMNSNRTDFLYQPREESITADGQTSALIVDKAPSYYVVLDVTDACGTNAKKIVLLECQDNKKKINTIFVDPSLIYSNTALKPIR